MKFEGAPLEERRGAALLLGGGLLALFLLTLSRRFNFDGVCFAQHVESGIARLLFHPNHLLYTASGRLAWRLERALFAPERALFTLQRMDAAAGALAGASLLLVLARRFPARPAAAAALAYCLGHAFWLNATDAQAYVPAALLGVLVLGELLADAPWPRAALATAAFALFHQLGALSAVPLAFHYYRRRGPRTAAAYLALSAGLCLAVYAAVAAAWPPEEGLARWFLGNSAPLSGLDPLFARVATTPDSLALNATRLARQAGVAVLGEPCPGPLGVLGTAAVWAFLGWLAWSAFKLTGEDRKLGTELALWMGAYLGFLAFTHDRDPGYFLFAFLPAPALALLAPRREGAPPRLGAALAALVPVLLLANLPDALLRRRLEANADWTKLERLRGALRPGDFLLFGGRTDYAMGRAYLPYFSAIDGTSLVGSLWRGENPEALPGRLAEAQRRGGQAYVLAGALDPEELSALESQFHLAPGRLSGLMGGLPLERAGDVEGVALYRLRPGYSPARP